MSGEQFSRPREAGHAQTAGCEVGRVQRHRCRIAVRIARDLAQHPIAAASIG
jgi:hypothetical protein